VLFRSLDEPAVDRLAVYFLELCEWNDKVDLVAPADDRHILEHHFLDSLTLLPLLGRATAESHLLDIGSGAGFPGLALKAARPQLSVTLVEPRRKRVTFLRHIVRTLGLQTIDVIGARLEEMAPEPRFSHITSRAFTSIEALLGLARPFCRAGGLVICMRGPKGGEEAEAWRSGSSREPYTLMGVHAITLPFSGASRHLLLFAAHA